MLKVFKRPINVNTPDGYKTAYGIRKLKKPALRVHFGSKTIDASLNHKFMVSSTDFVLCKNLTIGDTLSGYVIDNIEMIGEIDVYDLTDVEGKVYYTNDILSHNCEFLGSSDTLVNGDALKEIENRTSTLDVVEKVLYGLEMYSPVQKGHSYILSVDPAKDGIDEFSLSVTDISAFPFIQVAAANLQVDYIVMPEQLDTLGRYYNDALIIVENNEGAGQSITDTLWGVYEYENLYRDKNIDGRYGYKKYTGFRTTSKSRGLIIQLMKLFIEEGKLIINSKKTLAQLYTFTKNQRGKYIAEEGYKDDAVMACAIMFAPMMENKRFDDYKLFVQEIKREESTLETKDWLSSLDIGSMEDGSGNYEEERRRQEVREQFMSELGSEYSISEDEPFL